MDPNSSSSDMSKYSIAINESMVQIGDHNHQDNVRPDRGPSAAPVRPEAEHSVVGEDPARNVFVAYGRDDRARRALFDFLRSLGLRPLEWESILRHQGKTAPHLIDAVQAGLEVSAAAVILMTPDDIVRLHPDLHEPDEKAGEVNEALQPRPNVLIELGMAVGRMPGKVLLVKAGFQRDITDLSGLSTVRLEDSFACRQHIRERLETAGCRIDAAHDWHESGDFASLKALYRSTA